MGGVYAVDVEGGVGLGVAQSLRLGQHVRELAAGLTHRGQDEVAGAVEDTVDAQDPVGRQTLAQGFDDRDAARDRSLEAELGRSAFGERGEFGAVMGEHRLIGRDHGLAEPECRARQLQRRPVAAADQLADEIDLGVHRQRAGVVVPAHTSQIDVAGSPAVAGTDGGHGQRSPGTVGQERCPVMQQPERAGADGAKSGDADSQPIRHAQATASAAAPLSCRARNVRMLRTACRSRCRFSTSARRT